MKNSLAQNRKAARPGRALHQEPGGPSRVQTQNGSPGKRDRDR